MKLPRQPLRGTIIGEVAPAPKVRDRACGDTLKNDRLTVLRHEWKCKSPWDVSDGNRWTLAG